MKKSLFISLLLALAVLISACQPTATQPPAPTPIDVGATIAAGVQQTSAALPTAAPPPTQPPAPTAIPEQPAATPAVEPVFYPPSLSAVVWEWLGSTTAGAFTAAADPAQYQIEFQDDGQAFIKADCNNVIATYTLDGNNITITPGPTTLVACPEGSQGDLFTQQLASAVQVSFEAIGDLILSLNEGSSMTFAPQAIAVLPTPEPGAPSLTATANVNVRSGPSEAFPIYGVMPAGRVANLLGRSQDNSWWVVELPLSQGGIGWISARFSTVTGGERVAIYATPPLPEQVQAIRPGDNDPQATSMETLYVREGPGEEYAAFGTVPAGVTGLVIGRSQDSRYWVVRIDPQTVSLGFGWVPASRTIARNIENIPVALPPPAPEPVQTTCNIAPNLPYGVATTAVNLREGPSTQFPVVGGAQQGQCGQIVGRNQETTWWAVSTSQDVVWVSAAFVNAFNTANVSVIPSPPLPPSLPTPAPPAQPSGNYVITTDPLNVRTGPSSQYPSLGMVPTGTVFRVLGSANGWLNVELPMNTNKQGWISGRYALPYLGPVARPF